MTDRIMLIHNTPENIEPKLSLTGISLKQVRLILGTSELWFFNFDVWQRFVRDVNLFESARLPAGSAEEDPLGEGEEYIDNVARCEWCTEQAQRDGGDVPLATTQLDGEWLCEACADRWARGQAETEADERNSQDD